MFTRKLSKSLPLLLIVAFAIVFVVAGCGTSNKQETPGQQPPKQEAQNGKAEFTIRLGHANAPSDTTQYHVLALKFKELVEAKSNGRIKVDIYPAAQLGSENEQVRNTQLGSQEATIISIANLTPYAKSLNFLCLPYLFTSAEEGRAVLKKMNDQINDLCIKEAGVRILSNVDIGFRVLSTGTKPVKKLDDLHGLKIRVPDNPVWIATFKSWGVDPVPLPWSEVFSALSQKVIDGQETPYNPILSQKFYEVQKYITDINFIYQTSQLIISEKYFQKLPKDLQDVVIEAGKEAQTANNDWADKAVKSDREALEKNGMIMLGPPEDMDEWIKRARSTWPQFYELIGSGDKEKGKQVIDLVEKYKSEVAKK